MEEELIYKEYDMLHQEIEQKISLQNNLLIFMITTTVTIITLAIKSDSLLLYLFPFFIIIPITSRIAYYRMAMAKISAYEWMKFTSEEQKDNGMVLCGRYGS